MRTISSQKTSGDPSKRKRQIAEHGSNQVAATTPSGMILWTARPSRRAYRMVGHVPDQSCSEVCAGAAMIWLWSAHICAVFHARCAPEIGG
jgi:hypothetical protein